ncbi:MAG: HEAT repeat domain-containing protein [Chloroflexota bacterium]
MLSQLKSFIDLEPGELRPVTYLFLLSFFTGCAVIFSYTVAFSLFLQEFDESNFAYVFILAALLSLITGSLFTRLEQTISISRLFRITTFLLFVSSILLQIGLWLDAGAWLFWVLLIWYRLYFMIVNLSFWGPAGRVLNIQQGKRLFGFVSTGEDIAKIIGYATVPLAVTLFGLNNLLFINALTVLGLFIMIGLLTPYIHETHSSSQAEQSTQRTLSNLWHLFVNLFNEKYVRSIFLISFFGVFSYFIIDYGFYSVVRVQFDTPDSLAQFIGYFWMSVYICSFIVRLFITNQVLRGFGLLAGLLSLPVVFGLLSFGLLIFSSISGLFAVAFICMGLIKLIEDSFSISIFRSSSTLLYQPLPNKTSLSAQIVAESLIAPLGLGAAGIVILIFNAIPSFNLNHIAYIFLVIAIIRIMAVHKVFDGYVLNLNKALSQRRLQGALSDLGDSASLDVLQNYLDSDEPAKIVYVLDLMEKVAPQKLEPQLAALISHPNANVARAAVRVVGRLNTQDALPAVKQLAAKQTPVSPEALYTLIRLDSENAFQLAEPYLDHTDPALSSQAILGLLQFSSQENQAVAATHLKRLVESNAAEVREKAAEIIGQLEVDKYDELLDDLLIDPSPNVQKKAIQSLMAHNDQAELAEILFDQRTNKPLFEQLLHMLRFAKPEIAVPVLRNYFDDADPAVRSQVYESLQSSGYSAASESARLRVEQNIQRELNLASWAAAGLADLERGDEAASLISALDEMLDGIRHRVFLLLSFLYKNTILNRILLDMKNAEDDRQRALVLEALSNHISSKHRSMISPLMRNNNPAAMWRNLDATIEEPRSSFDERLETIIFSTDAAENTLPTWLKISAIYTAGTNQIASLKGIVASYVGHNDPLVDETAVWAINQFES